MRTAISFWMLMSAVFSVGGKVNAAEPIWAKKAVAFSATCFDDKDSRNCRPVKIPSPDGKSSVEVLYRRENLDDGGYVLSPFLKVTTAEKGTREATVPWGFGNNDLLWSPDSKAFFINGDNGGAYWGFWVSVYRVDGEKIQPIEITQHAQRDMVSTFPPCKATYLDEKTCKETESDPGYNMSGIDWADGSSAVRVMAEVPCAGSYGGIMCQVMGYEIDVASGRILKRVSARQMKQEWQKSMAFKFNVPEAPEYRSAEKASGGHRGSSVAPRNGLGRAVEKRRQ